MLSGAPVVFVQYSSQFLAPDDVYQRYYRHAYARMPGYVVPPHYMEIPHWIPQVAGLLPAALDRSLYVATDQEELIEFARTAADGSVFLFSVMDCNLEHVLEFARRARRPIIAGGYVDPAGLLSVPDVTFLSSVEELAGVVDGVKLDQPVDYELFRGERCIPRFRLSDGCTFGCHFCAVSPTLQLMPADRIPKEVDALEPLDFDVVYVSDKSFGEAPNWTSLAQVRDRILAHKPNFLGFTVQTTPAISCLDGMLESWQELGVRHIEFGLEICDDEQLARLGKPFRMHQMDATAARAADLDIKVIPDLLLGIPGADYTATVSWIADHLDLVPAVNVSWLAVEYGNPRGGLGLRSDGSGDRDQSSDSKTWLSPAEREHNWWALSRIYEATAPGFSFADAIAE